MEKQALQQRNLPPIIKEQENFPTKGYLSIYIGCMVDYIEIARVKVILSLWEWKPPAKRRIGTYSDGQRGQEPQDFL